MREKDKLKKTEREREREREKAKSRGCAQLVNPLVGDNKRGTMVVGRLISTSWCSCAFCMNLWGERREREKERERV